MAAAEAGLRFIVVVDRVFKETSGARNWTFGTLVRDGLLKASCESI